MKAVLIISHSEDYHVHKLIPLLDRKNTPYFILNLDKFPCEYSFTSQFDNSKNTTSITDLSCGSRIEFDDIGAIWLRKPAPFQYRSSGMDETLKEFCDKEVEHALFGALYGLSCFWVSHPRDLRASMWKGEQLQRATHFGFQIPDTLISQDPERIRQFFISNDKVIYKAMANDVVIDPDGSELGIATTLVDEAMLEDFDSLSLLPNLFQGYVEKAYELRVTVIGERVFAAKLDSQLHPETRIDCRNLNVAMPISPFQLPTSIEQACVAFVKSYGLNYSAMDFVVTPDEEFVFLENNPNGQFMFIEENVPELGILDALASQLDEACQ